jgi:phosphopantetheinyl transferase
VKPTVQVLDARTRGLDDDGLRGWARTESAGTVYASRSYRYPYAVVAVHSQPVGVDIERIEPVDRSFADSIVTPEERRELGERRFAADVCASLWAGKEALAKALGDPVAYDPRRLTAPRLWPGGVSGRWRAKAVPVPAGHVAWLCWEDSKPRLEA